jgi:hypothetical protein
MAMNWENICFLVTSPNLYVNIPLLNMKIDANKSVEPINYTADNSSAHFKRYAIAKEKHETNNAWI